MDVVESIPDRVRDARLEDLNPKQQASLAMALLEASLDKLPDDQRDRVSSYIQRLLLGKIIQ